MKYVYPYTRPKNVIASCRNQHGVRVFIPLKGQKDGHAWIKPIRFWVLRAISDIPLLFSFRTTAQLEVQFQLDELIFYTPFSMAMVQAYHTEAANMLDARAKPSSRLSLLANHQRLDMINSDYIETVEAAINKFEIDSGRAPTTDDIASIIAGTGHGIVRPAPSFSQEDLQEW